MRKASLRARRFSKLYRRRISNSLVRAVLRSLLCLGLFSGVVSHVRAADRRLAHSTVPQASVDLRPIRLPIVDGTDIRFTRLSTADGLSQTKASHIVQDDQGFMWFGTQYGLNRYDGYNFKVFVHDPGNPNSLSGVVVNALFKDRDGTLWVGCDQFLNKLQPVTETFTRYPVPFVTHISQDTAGVLWLATPSDGLYSLDPETGRICHYSHDPNDPSSLSSNHVDYSGEDRGGRFWVVNTGYLDEFDRRTGKVTRHFAFPEAPLGFHFYEDRFGVFWIFHGAPNALAVFDRKTNTLTHYAFPERKPPGTAVTGVTAMLEDRDGALWLATHGAGLLKFDREHGRFIRYRNHPADPDSLPQNNIDTLFADREGSIWAGPGRMGPTRFATKPRPFKRLPHAPGSTVEPFVGAIYEDREGILWIGTPEALNRIERKAGHYDSYRTGGPGVGTDVITIREDRSGNLWLGTYGHGLHRFDRRTGQFKTYRHNPSDPYSLSNDIVSRVLVDHNGTLWAGTQDGLNRFDAVTERFTTYQLEPQRIMHYLDLVEDGEGTLWLGTNSAGLQHFDPATGRLTSYEHNMNRQGTLSDNRVNSVYIDRSGTMWVGTQNGLDKFNLKEGTFTVYTRRDGLPGNAVGCVLEDDHGDLWMSTNNGITRFNRQSRTFRNYSTADGLPGLNLIGWGAGFKSPSGEMFFGGFNGATAFFPDKVVDSSYAPPIVLTDFRLSGNPVQIGGRSPLKNSISYTHDVTLSHQQNIFSLGFAALSYSNPATNRYRYKLDGLERDWNEVGSDRRQVTYTNLPVGRYTFRAQGATSSGAWSEPGVALRIEIMPPWWGTSWFRVASAVFILVTIGLLYRSRIHQLKQEFQGRLEERVGERTRIARELHDTLLQSFHGLMLRFQTASNLLPERPAEAKQRLDSAIDQAAQAITEGRDAIQGLRSSTVETNDIALAVSALGEELAADETNHNSAVFRVEVEGTPRNLHPMLRDEVYRIAGEALRNAFRHAQARRIEVEIRYDERQLRLRVRDDGKGIDPKVLKEEGRAGHWGLHGMPERAKLVGGNLEVWSELDSGTELELSIPASIAYAASPAPRRFWFSGKGTKIRS